MRGVSSNKCCGGVRWLQKIGCLLLLPLGYAAYIGIAFLCSRGLGNAFVRLFDAWGMSSGNMRMFPAWAQTLAQHYPALISLATNALVLLLCLTALKFLKGNGKKARFRVRDAGTGLLLGMAAALLSAALFVCLDSMRATRGGGERALTCISLLLVAFFAAAAEEAFDRAFVLRCLSLSLGDGKWINCIKALISGLMLALTTGAFSLGALGCANTVLLGALLADLHARGGAWSALSYRFGWSAATLLIVSYPGSNIAAQPIWQLYTVSEAWLTGGNAGLISGCWFTALLLIWSAAAYRPVRHLRNRKKVSGQ